MKELKGKTILIGKDATLGCLHISVNINGQNKSITIGDKGSVPASVSRCKPAESMAHCKIDIDDNGGMVISNMKLQNITYVNGVEIVSKKITKESKIALGRDMYPINLGMILEKVKQMMDNLPAAQQEYSIKHLEKVWNKYEATMEAIQRRQQKKGNMRMLPIMIGSVSGIAAPLLGNMLPSTYYITIPVSILSFAIYFKIFREKDTSIEDKKKATDYLIDNYVCPNKKCNNFLGTQSYKVLRQRSNCPYCKCKLKED